MRNKDVFKKLVYLEGGNKKWQISNAKFADSEKWLHHILPADAEAPNIEDEKRPATFLVVIGLSMLFLVLLTARLFSLQIIQGSDSLVKAERNRVREEIIRAPRGIIYDRNGYPLVKNIPNFDLTIIPADLPKDGPERDKIYQKLSEITGISQEQIKGKITKDNLFSVQGVLIEKNLDKNKALVIEANKEQLKGIRVEVNPIREYTDNTYLAHVLGYSGRISQEEYEAKKNYGMNDYIGKTGLEKSYEDVLRGVDGREKLEVEASGKQAKNLGTENPIPGNNLKLSIDFELQKKLIESMQKKMEEAKVKRGTAVAMNPQTGEILAMVNLPSFDNNLFAKGIKNEDYNKLLTNPDNPLLFRAITGEYPSGSVIKPFVAAAALEEKLVTENTTILSNGGINVGEFSFPDWKAGGHGATNVLKAIAESVNTYFYAIGGGYNNIQGLGPERMKSYLEKFGFTKYTELDVFGESNGSMPDPEWKQRVKSEPWYLGDTYHMAIGQGDVLVTPLQMANGTCAIANGGKLMKPHIVDSVLDGSGNLKYEIKDEVISNQVVSAETIEIVRRGMRMTVTDGSGRMLNSIPVPIAGKTGTAQFGPNNAKSHAWFTSFAPFDKPTISLTVLLEGAGGGDKYAVPVAYDVYKWYFSR